MFLKHARLTAWWNESVPYRETKKSTPSFRLSKIYTLVSCGSKTLQRLMSKFTANASIWVEFIETVGGWSRSRSGSSWNLNIRLIKCSKVDNHVDPCWWCRHNCSRQSYYRHIPGYSGRYSFRSEPCMLKSIFSRKKYPNLTSLWNWAAIILSADSDNQAKGENYHGLHYVDSRRLDRKCAVYTFLEPFIAGYR